MKEELFGMEKKRLWMLFWKFWALNCLFRSQEYQVQTGTSIHVLNAGTQVTSPILRDCLPIIANTPLFETPLHSQPKWISAPLEMVITDEPPVQMLTLETMPMFWGPVVAERGFHKAWNLFILLISRTDIFKFKFEAFRNWIYWFTCNFLDSISHLSVYYVNAIFMIKDSVFLNNILLIDYLDIIKS